MKKNLIIIFSILIVFLLVFSTVALAKDFELPEAGTAPDSSFYFLKSWKEKIQLFFTFNAEQKAKQYTHLAGVRFAEYQKMIEKGKTKIAEKTLVKYQNQLNRAIQKVEKLKNNGKNIKELEIKIKQTTQKHLETLNRNFQKVPWQAQKGIENAIENLQKQIEKNLKRPRKGCKNLCGNGVCQEIVCMAIGCPCSETKESCPQDCVNAGESIKKTESNNMEIMSCDELSELKTNESEKIDWSCKADEDCLLSWGCSCRPKNIKYDKIDEIYEQEYAGGCKPKKQCMPFKCNCIDSKCVPEIIPREK